MLSGPQVRYSAPMKGPILFLLETMSDLCLGYEYILSGCVTKPNQVMSGYGAFRHKLFPGPKGKHLSPYLPSRTEDTLWDQFPRGEFSPRGAPGAGPSAKCGEAGSPAQGEGFSKTKRRQRQGSLRRFSQVYSNSSSQSVICGTLEVTETLS